MRLSLGIAVLLCASASHAQDQAPTYHICTLNGPGVKGPYSTLAVTEPFPVDRIPGGMSTLEDAFESFERDLRRGRVSIPGIDPKTLQGGSCQAGSTDIADAHETIFRMREYQKQVFVMFPSPIGRDGRYMRPGSATAKAPTQASKAPAKAPLTDRPRAGNPLGKTPNQVKYELAMAVHQARLAKLAKEKADLEATKERQRAAAREVLSQHDQALAQHRQVVAASEREQAEYRQRLAGTTTRTQPDDEKVEFKEGVVLCSARTGSKSFSCQGPLQNVSTRMDVPEMKVALGQACGSDRSIRDLGSVSGYRAFGCGFGIHPTAKDYPGNTDVPAKLGVDYIPGRGSYFCPKSKLAYCR